MKQLALVLLLIMPLSLAAKALYVLGAYQAEERLSRSRSDRRHDRKCKPKPARGFVLDRGGGQAQKH